MLPDVLGGSRHIHFSRLKVEFANTDFKSPEQTASRSDKAVKFYKTQRRPLLSTFPVIRPAGRNRFADGYSHFRHIALQISCKTLSVKRNPLKTQNDCGHFPSTYYYHEHSAHPTHMCVQFKVSTIGPRRPTQLPQGSRNWHIQRLSSILIGGHDLKLDIAHLEKFKTGGMIDRGNGLGEAFVYQARPSSTSST